MLSKKNPMIIFSGFIIAISFIFVSIEAYSETPEVIYHSPVTNAALVLKSTNLVFKFKNNLLPLTNDITIKVSGSKSNNVNGSVKLIEDETVIVFDPYKDFKADEKVNVKLFYKSNSERSLPVCDFNFKIISRTVSPQERAIVLNEVLKEEYNFYKTQSYDHSQTDSFGGRFPGINVMTNNDPSGKIFCTNIIRDSSYSPYLMILNNDGTPYWSKKMPEVCYDFKVNSNGMLTYFMNGSNKFYAMDSSCNVTDSFYTGNGYETDLHDLRFLNNGNALLMSYDVQIVDMSVIVPGGQKDAMVTGLIIQEIDADKNVVFQWRSWDHFRITDADSINLSLGVVDYAHGNAIEIAEDGNYVISSRNMSEITKINKTNGQIMWRWGGKNNMFTFINDPDKFSYQHAIRRTQAGTYTLYDNGNFHTPKFSRGCEYRLNETTMTAELIWEYRHTPSIYSFAMGYVERLANGNTTISWGFVPVAFTEVNSNNEVVYEFGFDSTNFSYRVFRFDWSPGQNNSIPPDFVLTNNYPNPFNPVTNINFSLPSSSTVGIKVFDMLGKEVKNLFDNKNYTAGSHTITFDANGLSSGIYFYMLNVNGDIFTHKMVLTR